MMNLTLGNEEDSQGSDRIEERKSEQEDEEDDYQNQWMQSPARQDRIVAFEPINEVQTSLVRDLPAPRGREDDIDPEQEQEAANVLEEPEGEDERELNRNIESLMRLS